MDSSITFKGVKTVFVLFLALGLSLVVSSLATSESAKVQGFLNFIQKAQSLDEISEAFERAGLSPSEARELEAAIARPPYADKLKSLSGPVDGRAGAPPSVTAKRVVVNTAKKAAINGRAVALARRLKTKAPVTVRSVKAGATPVKTAAPPRTSPPGGGTSARITGLNPDPIRVGDRLNIAGTGFGSGRGTVLLATPEHQYICDLASWSDTRIEATIPGYMDSVIGDRSMDFRLRVMLQGNILGPSRDFRLHPSIRDPEVVSLSSDEIMPGNDVSIEGRWFYGRGSVEFDFGSQLFRGNIREWTDSLITAGIPEGIGGLHRTRGQLIIRNNQGREIRHPITFEPNLEEVTVTSWHEIDRTWKATGDVRTFHYFEYVGLKEGWLVVYYRKERVNGRGSSRYMLEPTVGTNRIHNIITLEAPSFTRLRVASHVTLKGPHGTPFW